MKLTEMWRKRTEMYDQEKALTFSNLVKGRKDTERKKEILIWRKNIDLKSLALLYSSC